MCTLCTPSTRQGLSMSRLHTINKMFCPFFFFFSLGACRLEKTVFLCVCVVEVEVDAAQVEDSRSWARGRSPGATSRLCRASIVVSPPVLFWRGTKILASSGRVSLGHVVLTHAGRGAPNRAVTQLWRSQCDNKWVGRFFLFCEYDVCDNQILVCAAAEF